MRLNLDRLQPRKPSLFLHTCATIHCLLVHCTCKHGWTLATGTIMDNAQDHHSVQQLQQCSEWHARQSNTKHHLMPSLYGHETWGDKGPHDSKPKHVGPTCSWLAGHKRLVKHVKPPSTRRTHPHYMPKRNSLQLVKIEMTCNLHGMIGMISEFWSLEEFADHQVVLPQSFFVPTPTATTLHYAGSFVKSRSISGEQLKTTHLRMRRNPQQEAPSSILDSQNLGVLHINPCL